MLAEAVHSVVDIANQVTGNRMLLQLMQPADSAESLQPSGAGSQIAFRD